jgi:hypothetical protein
MKNIPIVRLTISLALLTACSTPAPHTRQATVVAQQQSQRPKEQTHQLSVVSAAIPNGQQWMSRAVLSIGIDPQAGPVLRPAEKQYQSVDPAKGNSLVVVEFSFPNVSEPFQISANSVEIIDGKGSASGAAAEAAEKGKNYWDGFFLRESRWNRNRNHIFSDGFIPFQVMQ